MEEIGGALSLLAILGFVAFWIWHGEKAKKDRRQQRLEASEKLFDRIGSGEALTNFLKSEEGRRVLDELNEPSPKKQTGAGIRVSIISLLTAGAITMSMGAGFFYVAPSTEPELVVPGAMIGGIGAGCIIAAIIQYILGKSWGLLDSGKPKDSHAAH